MTGSSSSSKQAGSIPGRPNPVAIDGSWRLLAHNLFPVPFGSTIRVRLGDPIARIKGDAASIAAAAETWIEETLTGWRRALPGEE